MTESALSIESPAPSSSDDSFGPTALIVGRDPKASGSFVELVERLGFTPIHALTAADAWKQLRGIPPRFLIVDLGAAELPGSVPPPGSQLTTAHPPPMAAAESLSLPRAPAAFAEEGVAEPSRRLPPLGPVIELAGQSTLAEAVVAPASPGGGHPTDALELYDQVFRHSDKMRCVEEAVLRVAETDGILLIEGERGVGKELIARIVHSLSPRSAYPWGKINCASLPPEILESELFGREDGLPAGTGRTLGRLERARGGTFILENIGEMAPSLQPKVRRLAEDRELFRLNGRELLRLDVRLVATTHQDLASLMASGCFRKDLYQRLHEMSIVIPPLRERREEIPALQAYFRHKFAREFRREPPELTKPTLDLLVAYSWPGNVEELEHLIKRYVVLGDDSSLRAQLQTRMRVLRSQPIRPPASSALSVLEETGADISLRLIARQAAQQAEKAALTQVMEQVLWNRAEAARRLKISYKTLLTKLNQADFGKKTRTATAR